MYILFSLMFWQILIISLIEKRLEGEIDLMAVDFFIFYDWIIVAAPWQMFNSSMHQLLAIIYMDLKPSLAVATLSWDLRA